MKARLTDLFKPGPNCGGCDTPAPDGVIDEMGFRLCDECAEDAAVECDICGDKGVPVTVIGDDPDDRLDPDALMVCRICTGDTP